MISPVTDDKNKNISNNCEEDNVTKTPKNTKDKENFNKLNSNKYKALSENNILPQKSPLKSSYSQSQCISSASHNFTPSSMPLKFSKVKSAPDRVDMNDNYDDSDGDEIQFKLSEESTESYNSKDMDDINLKEFSSSYRENNILPETNTKIKSERVTSFVEPYPIYININKSHEQTEHNYQNNEKPTLENNNINNNNSIFIAKTQSISMQSIDVSTCNDNNNANNICISDCHNQNNNKMNIPMFPKPITGANDILENNCVFNEKYMSSPSSSQTLLQQEKKSFNDLKMKDTNSPRLNSPRLHVRFQDPREKSLTYDSQNISITNMNTNCNNNNINNDIKSYENIPSQMPMPSENNHPTLKNSNSKNDNIGFKVINVRPGYEFQDMLNIQKNSYSPNLGKKRKDSFFKKIF